MPRGWLGQGRVHWELPVYPAQGGHPSDGRLQVQRRPQAGSKQATAGRGGQVGNTLIREGVTQFGAVEVWRTFFKEFKLQLACILKLLY